MTHDGKRTLCDVEEGTYGPRYFVNGERVGSDTYLKVARLEDEIERLREDLDWAITYVPHTKIQYDLHDPECRVCKIQEALRVRQ